MASSAAEIQVIGILGAGQMGSGIAQTAAQAGFQVLLADRTPEEVERGKASIASALRRLVEKAKIQEDEARRILGAITTVSGLPGLAKADFVIEAVTERVDLKYQLFRDLDEKCPERTVLASNTSSISITGIAAQTRRPEKVVGVHFMNPVPVMKLVEGIRGLQTSDETFSLARVVAERMGKTFVAVKDMPGFAVNRILMPMINEAVYALHEGVASVEDIDAAMRLGTNQPMGPLTLADFVGLDTCLAILEVLHEGLGDPKYRPCPLLRQYVTAGWMGKKSGRGFYKYD